MKTTDYSQTITEGNRPKKQIVPNTVFSFRIQECLKQLYSTEPAQLLKRLHVLKIQILLNYVS